MLVRHELGPEASVIQTREISGKFFGLLGKPQIEVQASREAKVVRRIADAAAGPQDALGGLAGTAVAERTTAANSRRTTADNRFDMTEEDIAPSDLIDYNSDANHDEREAVVPVAVQSARPEPDHGSTSTAAALPHAFQPPAGAPNYLTPAMFEVFTEMLDADVDPDAARMMLQEVALHCTPTQLNDPWLIKGRLCQIIQQRVRVSGPIDVHSGQPQIVALVGPTELARPRRWPNWRLAFTLIKVSKSA